MTLSEFYRMMHPFCLRDDIKKKGEFVSFMISRIVEEQWETGCPVADSSKSYLRRIYNGTEQFPRESAEFMVAHIDKDRFCDELEELMDEASTILSILIYAPVSLN